MMLRVRRFIVTICVVASYCLCRPMHDKLPHSQDFYAGYIKALNDNFDALFKSERKTRSVPVIERQERGVDRRKVKLGEIRDENCLQQATGPKDDAPIGLDKELYKRDILGDEVNTKTVGKSEVTPSTARVFPKTNNDLGVDRVLLTSNITADDTSDDTIDEDETSGSSGDKTSGERKKASETTVTTTATPKPTVGNEKNNAFSEVNLDSSLFNTKISTIAELAASSSEANTTLSVEEEPDPYKEIYPTEMIKARASKKDTNSTEVIATIETNSPKMNERKTTPNEEKNTARNSWEHTSNGSTAINNNIISNDSNVMNLSVKWSNTTESSASTKMKSGNILLMDNNHTTYITNDNTVEPESDPKSSFDKEDQEGKEKEKEEEEEEESGERENLSGDYGSGRQETSGHYPGSRVAQPSYSMIKLSTETTDTIADTPENVSKDQSIKSISTQAERTSLSSKAAAVSAAVNVYTQSTSATAESGGETAISIKDFPLMRNKKTFGEVLVTANKAAMKTPLEKVSTNSEEPENFVAALRVTTTSTKPEDAKSESELTAAVRRTSIAEDTDSKIFSKSIGSVNKPKSRGAYVNKSVKTVKIASKKTEIKGMADLSSNFQDSSKEGDGKKRDLEQNAQKVDEEVSGEKKANFEDIADEQILSGESAEEELGIVKRNVTAGEPIKQEEESNYTSDEIEYEDTVTENDDKLLEDKTNKLNKTATTTDKEVMGITTIKILDDKLISKANKNNHVQKHTIPSTEAGETAFEAEETNDFDEDPDIGDDSRGTDTDVPEGSEVEEPDTDVTHMKEDTDASVKKTITAEEDNTDKVANFKEDQDIEDQVTNTNRRASQPKQAMTNEDETRDDDDVVATRRTIITKPANLKKDWPVKGTKAINPKDLVVTQADVNHQADESEKSAFKEADAHFLDNPPQTPELEASTMRTIKKSDKPVQGDTIEEQNSRKSVPDIEPVGYRQVDSINGESSEVSMNEAGYIAPVTFFQQPTNGRRDEEDELRRHIILDRPDNPDISYLSSLLTERFPHVLRDAIERNVEKNAADLGDVADAEEGAYGTLSTHERPTQLFQDDQDASLVKWLNPSSDLITSVPPIARSVIATSYLHNTAPAKHDDGLLNAVIRAPLSLIENFIQSGRWKESVGSVNDRGKCYFPHCYRSEDDDAEEGRWYSPHVDEGKSDVRSVIIPNRHHQPLMLQPIFVLMPLSVNKT